MALTNENRVVTDATLQRPEIYDIDGNNALSTPIVATPPGYELHDLERLLVRPNRQRGRIIVTTPESFVRAASDGDPESARVYVDELVGTFTGILNHGKTNEPGWGDYVVVYEPAYSIEFKEWHRLVSQGALTQDALAQFLEDHFADVASMSGGELLALVRDFKVSMSGSFSRATNLSNGSIEFAYAMENKGKSSIEVPELLVLGLPMFEGTEKVEIPVRFKYRLNEARLTFALEFVGFQRLRQAEFRKIRTTIESGLQEYQVLDGKVG